MEQHQLWPDLLQPCYQRNRDSVTTNFTPHGARCSVHDVHTQQCLLSSRSVPRSSTLRSVCGAGVQPDLKQPSEVPSRCAQLRQPHRSDHGTQAGGVWRATPEPLGCIHILLLSGNSIALSVESCTLVHDVKAEVQDREGAPVDQQRLIFMGQDLQDGRTLAFYDVVHNSTINLVGTS